MDLNVVAQDLFDELKSRFSNLTLGDDQAQTTTDPQTARFFKFDWNNNPVSISIDEENLRLIYNKNLTDSVEPEQEQQWYDFARYMREFAVKHNIGFKPQDIEKVDLEQGDFEFLSQVNTVQESKMHGTPKTSYDKLDKTKMIIRHSKQVDETIPGARSRNIDCIFIENAQGERFRFPYNYLKGARAMMMHVAQGGNPYDEIGESIVRKVEEIRDLRNFNSYTVRQGLLDETTAPYVEAAKTRIQETIKTLEQLAKAHTYESALGNLKTESQDLSEDDLDAMKKKFTKETFDDSIVDAFKLLPMMEFKPDDATDQMSRSDIMKMGSTASRFKGYVDSWLNNPESKLILKKDDSYDEFQNNLRSQQKDTMAKLGTIMRDIAGRFLSANPEDDAVANFASDMEQQLSMSGELFAKPNPEMKALKGTAIKLANKYLSDMKQIKSDDAYKDEVRKSPEDIKAYKDIKGQEIGKGKLAKAYKRKYKDESQQFEAWVDSQLEGLNIVMEDEEIVASDYQDAHKKKTDQLEVTEAPKRFPEGHYTHTPGALEVMPSQDKTLWADAGELPKKFNVTKMKIAIYDEQDDEDPYSYGNGGLIVYHNAGTWKMYTDDVTRVQIADYLGIPNKDIDFSEQGMQSEEYMHFDIEDDAVAQLISKGAFKLEETTNEDGMGQGSLDQFRKLYRKSIGSDDAEVTLRELINVINDDSLWSDQFPQLKQFTGVSPHSGSRIVTAKKIPGATADEKIQSLVKAIDDDNWVNATAKHLMRSYTLGEDDMSTGTVPVGKKGKTRRATGIDDNPYSHNEGEDQTALANAALWNMKDVYQTLMAGESLSEDDMFAYGDLVQYLEQADMPDHYSKFWDLVVDAINAEGGFKGQGDEIMVDKNIAPTIKTLYQKFKAATANIKGVKEGATFFVDKESGKRIYIPDAEVPMPRLLKWEWQPDISKALRHAAGLPDSAYVYFDDADLVYGEKTVWPGCGVDDKCTFGDAVKALKKFAKANPLGEDEHDSWTKVTNALIKKFGKDKAEVITDYAQIMTDSAEEIMKSHGLAYEGDLEEDEKAWFKKYPWLEKLNNTSWMGRLFDLAGEGPDYGTPVKMEDSDDIYGYTWNCKKCGAENEFTMSRQDAQQYIEDWEREYEDEIRDDQKPGEAGEAALTDTLSQGEDSGFHYGNKCVKCGTEAKDPYQESINDILRLSGLK